ncbi:ATP-binding protein, partial [Pseudomonas sp. I2]
GLGLGLSLVQRICDDQGWRVTLTATLPHGCRFQVDLSQGSAPAPDTETRDQSPASR